MLAIDYENINVPKLWTALENTLLNNKMFDDNVSHVRLRKNYPYSKMPLYEVILNK